MIAVVEHFAIFFIGDPEQHTPLKSNNVLCIPNGIIIGVFRRWNHGKLPSIVEQHILAFLNLASAWGNETKDKEFRSRVPRPMLEEKPGWGWVQWGNTGTTEFVSSLCTWGPGRRREAQDHVHHTKSE
ncbi:unnamed protein product [Rotaria sp. Silwood1]|nr:unnamed protein product [Rotaria sp. Silwood1]CAF1629133.1 unnamed protein product [Rotaria sp. Silwood1]CAF3758128.1 unnamed protein product [Rotaria sp. Silwood1]CAF3807368.1 unnamed protein product [Rotaria sp. Silwood1]CAF3854183.1 unnamed protein product [Rotaria sp. Silwood1]